MARFPSSARSAAPAKRFGSEVPRVFTPPLRELTDETSLGFDVIEFATETLGIDLYPWQKWLLIHALELLPDGTFRFRNVVVLVARQNGKSTLSQVLSLFAMYVLGIRLVIGTAQDLDVAKEIWQGAVDLVEEIEELNAEKLTVKKAAGQEALILKTGERYKVKAANRRAGRGLSGDLILLDELREHQTWDAWGAITKTTMARPNAQVWALSNAGDVASIVLRYLRKMAHLAIGDPDGINAQDDPGRLLLDEPDDDVEVETDEDSLGIFEWSAAPGCDVLDRDGWAQANPSLGYGITERTVASAAKTDPEWVFRTEVLCQWSDGTLEGPFPPGAWEQGVDPASSRDGDVVLGLDVSWDRSMSHIALIGRRSDGLLHGEVIASRAGTDWVVDWFKSPDRSPAIRSAKVAAQRSGAPVSSLIDELLAAGVDVIEWGGPDLAKATGSMYDLVRDGLIKHRPQPVLDVPAATAVMRTLADGAQVFDRKRSPVDVSPLIALTAAAWQMQPKAPEPVKVPTVHAWAT